MKIPCLIIVIPCYNEEKVLPITAPLFLDKLRKLTAKKAVSEDSRILFVNDGSTDRTWELICRFAAENEHFLGICLSRNRGHQNAVLAGLMEAKEQCDISISIDCDGQDDINAMDEMIEAYKNGAEIVYGVRNNRDADSWFKKLSAESFYKLLHSMGCECVYNHADYRLVSVRVLEEIANFKEVNLYLRGIFPLVGFNSTSVYYKREGRLAGKSNYPFKQMLALALDGITSLSVRPIRLITLLGTLFSLFSFAGVIYALISALTGNAVSGWASLTCIVCFLGGIQLLALGIIGEYIGKIYLESKHRPRYIISERTGYARAERPADGEGLRE